MKAIAFSSMVDIAERELNISFYQKKVQYQAISGMKTNFPHLGLASLCAWFGVTRQAYYQNIWRAIDTTLEEELIIKEIQQIRKLHPRMGTRKLYEKLEPFMLEHGIKMGRDALFNLVSTNHLQVRRRRRRVNTTQSNHWLRKYPNLIREFVPTAPNQLWVSDITYWKINTDKYMYISFITDAYSHKIVGYNIGETLGLSKVCQLFKKHFLRCKKL